MVLWFMGSSPAINIQKQKVENCAVCLFYFASMVYFEGGVICESE